MLHLPIEAFELIRSHALACYPLEMCGLIAGGPAPAAGADNPAAAAGDPTAAAVDPTAGADNVVVAWFQPTDNVANSSKVYTVDPRQHLAADRRAEDEGLEIIGVVHSHTHTEPYPSPTDIAQAVDPGWHYLILSLRDDEPMLRSWRIVDGTVTEEPVVVVSAA